MGTLSTEAQRMAWNVKSDFQSIMSNAQNFFNSVIGRAGAAAGGILNGDVVGINVAEIGHMQEAIREYVNNLQTHLDQVKADADTSQAFMGDYASGVRAFVDAVCTACECVISNLLQFNQKLEEVKEKYLARDEQLNSELQAQAGELSSNFTKYTE